MHLYDLSASSAELCDSSGTFSAPSWKENERHLIENHHDHPDLQPFSRVELHALAFPNDAMLAFIVEDEIRDFQNSSEGGLKFIPMIPFHRRIVSDCAARHGLETLSMGNGLDRHVVVLKVTNEIIAPALQYKHAYPTASSRENLLSLLGYKRKKSEYSTEFENINGQVLQCRTLTNDENLKPFIASKQDSDRSEWMKYVHDTARRGIPIPTHAHIVEVRITNPEKDEGQVAELQKFLGPFHVKWLHDDKTTGIGVVVYPSVPAANNCLDRYEDEDDADSSTAAFRLYPFAPHTFGAYLDDQTGRRYPQKDYYGSGSSTPMGKSPSSTPGGSWRDGTGSFYLDKHVGERMTGKWQAGVTPPLVPRDHGNSPPLHPKSGWSPKVSPGNAPQRSPGLGSSAHNTPNLQPLSLGRGKWLEVKGGAGGKGNHNHHHHHNNNNNNANNHHADADNRSTLEIYLPKDKQVKDILDMFSDVAGHTKSFEGKLYIDFNTPEASSAGLKEAQKAGLKAKAHSRASPASIPKSEIRIASN